MYADLEINVERMNLAVEEKRVARVAYDEAFEKYEDTLAPLNQAIEEYNEVIALPNTKMITASDAAIINLKYKCRGTKLHIAKTLRQDDTATEIADFLVSELWTNSDAITALAEKLKADLIPDIAFCISKTSDGAQCIPTDYAAATDLHLRPSKLTITIPKALTTDDSDATVVLTDFPPAADFVAITSHILASPETYKLKADTAFFIADTADGAPHVTTAAWHAGCDSVIFLQETSITLTVHVPKLFSKDVLVNVHPGEIAVTFTVGAEKTISTASDLVQSAKTWVKYDFATLALSVCTGADPGTCLTRAEMPLWRVGATTDIYFQNLDPV